MKMIPQVQSSSSFFSDDSADAAALKPVQRRDTDLSPRLISRSWSAPFLAGSKMSSPEQYSATNCWDSACFFHENYYMDSVDDDGQGDYDDYDVLGPAPTKLEAESAVHALQLALLQQSDSKQLSTRRSSRTSIETISTVEEDWIEPSDVVQICKSELVLQDQWRYEKVYEAFSLLQTDPCIKRMVVSLSSDEAVWEAVLKNQVVQKLRESRSFPSSSNEDRRSCYNAATSVLRWILNSTKTKAVGIIDLMMKAVTHLVQFQPLDDDCRAKKSSGSAPEQFEEKLRSGLMLTVMILLIVVARRAHDHT